MKIKETRVSDKAITGIYGRMPPPHKGYIFEAIADEEAAEILSGWQSAEESQIPQTDFAARVETLEAELAAYKTKTDALEASVAALTK